jgi:hypothetical protein
MRASLLCLMALALLGQTARASDLEHDELISPANHYLGAAIGTFGWLPIQLSSGDSSEEAGLRAAIAVFEPTFGLGQLLQGRYARTGYIATVGELGSLSIAFAGALSCFDTPDCSATGAARTLIVIGGIGYLGFRLWEIADLWAGPFIENRRENRRAGREQARLQAMPWLIPGERGVAGGLSVSARW